MEMGYPIFREMLICFCPSFQQGIQPVFQAILPSGLTPTGCCLGVASGKRLHFAIEHHHF